MANDTAKTVSDVGIGTTVEKARLADALGVQGTLTKTQFLQGLLNTDPVPPEFRVAQNRLNEFDVLNARASGIARSAAVPFTQATNAVFNAGASPQTDAVFDSVLNRRPGQFAAPPPRLGESFSAPSGSLFKDNFARKQGPSSGIDFGQAGLLAQGPQTGAERLGVTPGTPPSENARSQAIEAGPGFIRFTHDGQGIISRDVEGNQFFVGGARVASRDGQPTVTFNNLVDSGIISPLPFDVGEFIELDQEVNQNFSFNVLQPDNLQELFDNGIVGGDVMQQLIGQGLIAQDQVGHTFVRGTQSRRFDPVSELVFTEPGLPPLPSLESFLQANGINQGGGNFSLFNESLNLPVNVFKGIGSVLF